MPRKMIPPLPESLGDSEYERFQRCPYRRPKSCQRKSCRRNCKLKNKRLTPNLLKCAGRLQSAKRLVESRVQHDFTTPRPTTISPLESRAHTTCSAGKVSADSSFLESIAFRLKTTS